MQYVKKLASILVAVISVFVFAAAASAAGTGSITIDNAQADGNYTAYKIFDVSYNTDKTTYSYTISKDSEWFSAVQTFAAEEGSGMQLTQINDEEVYNVTITDDFRAPAFAAALKLAVAGKSGSPLTVKNGQAKVEGLELGYYFVTSSTGALCNLTTTNPNVTIHDKNEIVFDKIDDQESVEVGQIVHYVITSKVPDYTGYETYIYQISDKMSDGLTFNNDVKVYLGGEELAESTGTFTLLTGGSAIDLDSTLRDFVLNFNVKNLTIGTEIKVMYSATVNKNAVAQIERNKAKLIYSNDPADSEKTGKREDEETVYSAKLLIDKYETGNENTKLSGAKFVLYKEVSGNKQYYQWNEATTTNKESVSWTDDKEDATIKQTDQNGAASFDGLKNGTYYLEEIEAPEGYNRLTEPVQVVINGANATEADLSSLTTTKKVENKTGTLLPSTGGMGTGIFYGLGSILAIGAGVLLVTKKRMRNSE